jgi:fatty-acyl-CoA synthase
LESTLPESRQLSVQRGPSEPPLVDWTVGQALDRAASQHPQVPALIVLHQNKRFNYEEFRAEVELVARGLMSLGIRKGDRVGVWAANINEWVVTQFATAKIGAVQVNINPSYRSRELEYALRQSECQTLILIHGFRDADYVAILNELCTELRNATPGGLKSEKFPHLRNVIFAGENTPPGMMPWEALRAAGGKVEEKELRSREATLDAHDTINIQYTSGTTGFPKAVMLSHHNIVNNSNLIGGVMKITDRDKVCIPVPFYHCFGMVIGNLMCAVRCATMVVPAAHFDPVATLRAVAIERCTALYGVPTMFLAELEHPEFSQFDLTSLRTGVMAGSNCPIELMKRVVGEMHCPELTIGYGLTETSPVVTQTSPEDPLELRVSTVGKVMPHTELKIIDPFSGKTVPVGVPGELCARGYMVMKGYYHDDESTQRAIDREGWLHSGDLATLDENGYCRITGRIKDLIIRGGENISPREIEEFLYTCPAISDVQIIGVPDRKYGEQVVACVRIKKGASMSAEELQAFCKGKIADFKIPRHVMFMDSFPMTVTGKMQKYKLREQAIRELGLSEVANPSSP